MKKSRNQASSGRAGSSNGRGTTAGTRKSASASSRSSSSSSRTSGSSGRSAPGSKTTARSSSASRAVPARSTSKSNGRTGTSSRGRKQTSPREDLTDVLKDGLKDIYYAEKQLVKALKKVSKAATSSELRQAFDTHREQTEEQIGLLEQAFEAMEMRAAGKKCPAMDGLIEEANEHIGEMDKGPALDAALIVGAQKIEHYEIAAYGSLRAFARCLGLSDCEQIFDQILQQESETDELLTGVAERVNLEALSGEEGMEGSSNGSARKSRSSGARVEMGEMEEEQM